MSHLLRERSVLPLLDETLSKLCCKLVPSDPEGTALILTRVFENLVQSPDLVLASKLSRKALINTSRIL